MSAIKNLFNRNQQQTRHASSQPSHLLTEPAYSNASQLNNNFLHHHKPLGYQNSQGLWQTAPQSTLPLQQSTLPLQQSTLPLQQSTLPLQQSTPYWQTRGLNRTPYRQIRLRTQNWGHRSDNGWSEFSNWRYLPQNVSQWEPESYLLSELRAQRGLGSSFNQDSFFQQWQQQRFGSWGQQQQGFATQRGLGLNRGFSGLSLNKSFVAPQQFVQTIMKPAIVQETIRTDRVLQIQPILHRAVEQNVINHIEKHITEAPAAPMGGVVRMAPVIQETTQTRVIEEIQPVVHREVAIAQVERVEEHLSEHFVAPTQHTNRVLYESTAPVAPIAAPITPILNSAPLTNTANITKVVPTGLAGSSPLLLEKQQQAPIVQPVYGSAMM